MKKMKQLSWLMLAAMLILSACTKNQQGYENTENNAAKPVTITYGIWDDTFKPFLDKIITSFEASNPSIRVDMQIVPWSSYWTKLQTALSGGQAWDVFWINAPYFPTYQQYGIVTDLSEDYREAGVNLADFPSALVDMYQVDGKPYTLPWFFDTVVLYYNKQRFSDAGLEFPNENWTLDDVQSAAQKLTTSDKKWGAYVGTDSQVVWGMIYSNGGNVFTSDRMKLAYLQPESLAVWRKLYNIVEKGFSPIPSIIKAGGGNSALRLMLADGSIAMTNDGSWSYGSLLLEMGDNLGVAPLPAASLGKERRTILHGLGHIAYAKSKHLVAAKKFAVYMTSPEAQAILANADSVMPAYGPALKIWIENSPNPQNASILADGSKAYPYPVSKTGGLEWNTRTTEIINDIFDGNIPFESGMQQAVSEANSMIEQ